MGRKAAALVIALLIVLLFPGARPVRAADGITQTADSTFELVPAQGLVNVTIDVTLTNSVPSTVAYVPCTEMQWDSILQTWWPYPSTCPHTTNYYVNTTEVWLLAGATNIQATSPSGQVFTSADSQSVSGLVILKLTFPSIFNGQTAHVRVTYTLPGGEPRSNSPIRAGTAYAQFCAFTDPVSDSGSIRVIIPAAFAVQTWGGSVTSSQSGGMDVYTSGAVDPANFYTCFEATNLAAYTDTDAGTLEGHEVEIQSWPDDPTWQKAVGTEVARALPALEQLVGLPVPEAGKLIVREVSEAQLGGDYAGDFDPTEGVARVSEVLQPATVTHELSHAWFNGDFLAGTWLDEGYAQFAEQAAGPSEYQPCGPPAPYAGTGAAPALNNWSYAGPTASKDVLAGVSYEYAAACWIVTDIGNAIGDARMAAVLQAAAAHEIAYVGAGTPETQGGGATDWKTWLDLVDERGMVPAGRTDLDLVQNLLVQFGVAQPSDLTGRSAARAQYHELETVAGTWAMPYAIREPMASWDFSSATSAMTTAAAILDGRNTLAQLLPSADVGSGKLRDLFEQAKDASAEQALLTRVHREVNDADQLKTDTQRLARAGAIESIGLAGTDVRGPLNQAASALGAVNPGTAEQALTRAEADLSGAQSTGLARVGGVVALLLLGVAATVFVAARRRRPTLLAEAGAEAADAVPNDYAPPVVETVELAQGAVPAEGHKTTASEMDALA